jgi:prephenate dehydratase
MIANQQENAMTNVSKVSLAIAAAAVSVGFAISFSSPAKAAGSMLEKCQPGSSRAIVERCCATWVRKNGRPLWMVEAVASCSDAVACKVGKKNGGPVAALAVATKKTKCRINILHNNGQGSNNNPGNDNPNTYVTYGNLG